MRMNQYFLAPSVMALGLALASAGANAQSVISRSVTVEPVETTVTQTPNGTVVTRRPLEGQPLEGQVAPPLAQPPIVQTGPAMVESDPRSIDSVTTRAVVERAAVTEAMRPARRTVTRQTASHATARRDVQRRATPATQRVVRRTTTATRAAPRLALNPRERHIIYQTIVERQVLPGRQVVIAPPPVVAQPPLVQRQPPLVQRQVALRPPIVAADESASMTEPVYTVGSVLPPNVPLYAMPQNVALGVPAAQAYSYAYLGGRAYLVDPATGTIVEDVTE
jgi:hypothetical protein